jgi:diamine N-acetyltransferase
MTADTAARLGPAIAGIGPWAHYDFTPNTLIAFLRGEMGDSHRFEIRCAGQPAGAVVIRYPWLAGPYLQMLAVLPDYQRQNIGARVLDWYEAQAAQSKSRQVWLCVTAANVNAQRFYRRQGYELTATLDGLMRDGDDELLMRKRLRPNV